MISFWMKRAGSLGDFHEPRLVMLGERKENHKRKVNFEFVLQICMLANPLRHVREARTARRPDLRRKGFVRYSSNGAFINRSTVDTAL